MLLETTRFISCREQVLGIGLFCSRVLELLFVGQSESCTMFQGDDRNLSFTLVASCTVQVDQLEHNPHIPELN